MSSNHVEDSLTEYIDGQLTGAAFHQVKSHLVFCTSCRQLHQDILLNIQKLKSLSQIQPSKELEKRIIKTLSESGTKDATPTEPARPSWPQWFLSFRGMSLAGAALLLIFIVQNTPKMVKESSIPPGPIQLPKTEAVKDESSAKPSTPAEIAAPVQTKVQNTVLLSPPTSATDAKTVLPTTTQVESKRMIESVASESVLKKAASAAIAGAPIVAQKQETIDNQMLSGFSSGITQPLEKVISDQKTWEEYWTRHQKGLNEQSPPPTVDFEKSQIIAVFAGNQPTAGFRVEITRVLLTQWENAPARVIRYRVSGPPEGAVAATVITQPYCMKIVPKADGPTFFRKIR